MKSQVRKGALTVERLWQIERIGSPALSPDGRTVACSVTRGSMEENTSATALWLLPVAGGAARRLTTCGDKDGAPAWSPRGDRIAFLARRRWEGQADRTPQLYVIPADGGEAVRCSDFAPGIESFKWLPDGRRIAFTAWVWPDLKGAAAQQRRHHEWADRKETGYVTSEAYYRYWDHDVPMGRVLHLLLLDLRSGRVTDLFEGSTLELPRDAAGNEVYDVHPDGRRIAFAHDPAAVQVLGNRGVLSEIDVRSRQVTRLVDDPAWDLAVPRYGPGGQRLAFGAARIARAHTALLQPAVRDAEGRWRALGDGDGLCLGSTLRWSADGEALYYTAELRGRCPLWRHALDAEEPVLAHEGGWVQGHDVAGDTVAVVADGASHPARVLARTGTGEMRRIESFNDHLLRDVRWGEVREVQVRGAAGEDVQVWLTFPPGFDAGRRHPVTHVIHGGPFAAAGDTFSYRWNPHVFAAAGHVVAQVNYHGSSGFGFDFRHSLIGRQGELELQDIEAATDWLLAQPWCDGRRVYATGGSYGGFLVAWMNGHVPAGRYRAYVCHAGVYDRVSTFSADSYPERPRDLAARYWEDLPRVLAQSPSTFAGAMETPTLVIHGARDYRVPDCNGLAYYNTLKARGVDARLLWFPDENHWVLKPRNSRQWYAEFAAWLDRHGGGPTRGRKPRLRAESAA